jgi:DNA-binding GntR family transcriptional regulator
MVELDLAAWAGVSRTPVREAFRRLEQDGMITRGERGGLMVRVASPATILDLYETRITLESMAAAVAAERRTPFDLSAMRRCANLMAKVAAESAEDPGQVAEANREFHRTIWVASHNEPLMDLLERLNLHIGRYSETTLSYPGRLERANVQHQAIIDAIDARDADTARAEAIAHFTEARDIRLKVWESDYSSTGQF